MGKAVAPYLACNAGDKNQAVVVVRRALARAGHGKLVGARLRPTWGDGLTVQLNAWRKTAGIRSRKAEYTREDHQKLARWWDQLNQRLAHEEQARRDEATREARLRARVVAKLMFLYNRRLLMRYTQQRAYDRRNEPTGLDCSSTKAWADEKAGAPKSGSPWGYGNTYTQLDHYRRLGRVIVQGRDVYAGVAKPADPVYYGGPSHVTVYLGGTRCASFGSFPMKILDVDYRGDRVAVCSLL